MATDIQISFADDQPQEAWAVQQQKLTHAVKTDILKASSALSSLTAVLEYVVPEELAAFAAQMNASIDAKFEKSKRESAEALEAAAQKVTDSLQAKIGQMETNLKACLETKAAEIISVVDKQMEILEQKMNSRLDDAQAQMAMLQADLNNLTAQLKTTQHDINESEKRLHSLVEGMKTSAEPVLGFEAAHDSIESVVKGVFSVVADGAARSKRIVLMLQEKANVSDMQELHQRFAALAQLQNGLQSVVDQTTLRMAALTKTSDELNMRVMRIAEHPPAPAFAPPAPPIQQQQQQQQQQGQPQQQQRGSLDGSRGLPPAGPKRSVDWAAQFAEAEDIKALKERLEDYMKQLRAKVDRGDFSDALASMKADLSAKYDEEIAELNRAIGDMSQPRNSDADIDAIVRAVQQKVGAEPSLQPAAEVEALSATAIPELENLNAQLHKVLVKLLVKADRADVDEVARRFSHTMQAIADNELSQNASIQQQLERIRLLLNFKVDRADVLSKIDMTRHEVEGKLMMLERSQRQQQERQMSTILEKMKHVMSQGEAKKEGHQPSAFSNVVNRSLSSFASGLAKYVGSEPVHYNRGRMFGTGSEYVVLQPSQWPYNFGSGPLVLKQGHPVRVSSSPSKPTTAQTAATRLSTVNMSVAARDAADTAPQQCMLIGVDGQIYRGDASSVMSGTPGLSVTSSPALGTRPQTTASASAAAAAAVAAGGARRPSATREGSRNASSAQSQYMPSEGDGGQATVSAAGLAPYADLLQGAESAAAGSDTAADNSIGDILADLDRVTQTIGSRGRVGFAES